MSQTNISHPYRSVAPRRRARRGAAVITASILALALTACGGTPSSTPSTGDNASAGEPVSGGTFTYVTFEESNGFDPVLLRAGARAGDSSQASAIFGTLMHPDPETLEMQMDFAQSLESEDFLTWDLVIRDGITFSDGTAYDAEAVKFNWERVGDPANGSPSAGGMAPVSSLEVVDPLTLRITLKSAYPQFPMLVARYLNYIGSPTAITALGDGFAQAPVAAGPFVVESWVRDSQLVMKKNPTYYEEGRPYLDELVFQQVADDEQRFNTFVSGSAQGAVGGPNTIYGQRAKDQGFNTVEYTLGGGITMIFNTTAAPFDDVEVRRGVAMALDLANVNDVINQGTNSVPDTLFAEGTPFHAPEVPFLSASQDKAEAQAIFDDYAERTGGPLSFEMTVTTAMAQTFELLQSQLGEYDNVEVGFSAIQPSALVPTLQNGEFDAATYALYSDDIEPSMFEYYRTGGKTNFTGISDPELDAALDAGRSTADIAERADSYTIAQERIAELVPEIYIQRYNFTYLLAQGVGGFTSPTSGIRWADVWISQS